MAYKNRTDLFLIANLAQKKMLEKQRKKSKSAKKLENPYKSLGFNESCSPTQKAGQIAEDKALQYLITNGLELLERNLMYKTGEIDLVMRDIETMVFIEVRMRNNKYYGNSLDSINKSKQVKIIRTAKFYLNHLSQKHFMHNIPNCRFDVIGIHKHEIKWVKDAFEIASI